VPSLNHGQIQFLLSGALLPYRNQYTIASEVAVQLDDLRVTPDLCVYPKLEVDYQRDVVRMTEPPLLAVEIVSPTQSTQAVVDKITGMLEAGVGACWLVQPAMQTITVYTKDAKPRTVSEGTLTDPATEIEIDVSDVFET
jgi:Uma2 family endonuclease